MTLLIARWATKVSREVGREGGGTKRSNDIQSRIKVNGG